jgi:hypothetical protein
MGVMTVRAVDMQTQIGRLNEVSRLQHQNDVQPHVLLHAQTQVVKTQAERAQTQVNRKPQAEQPAVNRDGKGGGGGAGGNRPQPQAKQASAEKPGLPSEPGRGHRLDVKL